MHPAYTNLVFCDGEFVLNSNQLIMISEIKKTYPGFYTMLNVWGSLGLNFDYDGGPIIENGGPFFLYKRRILGGSKSFREGIRTGLSCQTGVAKHKAIFASQPFVARPSQLDRNFRSFLGGCFFLEDLD